MEASFVDLRRKSAEIIKALSRKERVTVFYRGKPAAIMHPISNSAATIDQIAENHPVFGIWADRNQAPTVDAELKALRRRRYDDL